jgi:hypothetical protein
MRKDWRFFVFWLGVGLAGAAIWLAWWAVSGFQVPICQEIPSDASVTDHCLSYDEIRAWTAQTSDFALRVAARANNWAALIIAIFTAILTIFLARLWRSTQKLWTVTNRTLQHAEQRSQKELRAYVSVGPLGITEYAGHNLLVGRFAVRNIASFCHRYPCEMFGASGAEATGGRVRNRSIDRKFARYHEEAGNEAG